MERKRHIGQVTGHFDASGEAKFQDQTFKGATVLSLANDEKARPFGLNVRE